MRRAAILAGLLAALAAPLAYGGDVFKFLELMENMTFPEAVRRLAQRANIVIPEGRPQDPKMRSQREELLALHAGVAGWWAKLLHSDPAAEPARTLARAPPPRAARLRRVGRGAGGRVEHREIVSVRTGARMLKACQQRRGRPPAT